MSLEVKFQQLIHDLSADFKIDAVCIPNSFKQSKLRYKRMTKIRNYSNTNRRSHNPVFLKKSLRIILNKMRFDRHYSSGALFAFDDRIRACYQNPFPFKRKNKTPHHKLKRKRRFCKLMSTKSTNLMGSYYNGNQRKSRRLLATVSV